MDGEKLILKKSYSLHNPGFFFSLLRIKTGERPVKTQEIQNTKIQNTTSNLAIEIWKVLKNSWKTKVHTFGLGWLYLSLR